MNDFTLKYFDPVNLTFVVLYIQRKSNACCSLNSIYIVIYTLKIYIYIYIYIHTNKCTFVMSEFDALHVMFYSYVFNFAVSLTRNV